MINKAFDLFGDITTRELLKEDITVKNIEVRGRLI